MFGKPDLQLRVRIYRYYMTDGKKTYKLIFKVIKLDKNQKVFLKMKMADDGNVDVFVTRKEYDQLEAYAKKYKLFYTRRITYSDREAGIDRKIK